MTGFAHPDTLRQHRPLLLAMEAIGWLHMTGKARAVFLREYAGQPSGYDDRRWHEWENPPFPWHDLLGWTASRFSTIDGAQPGWPQTLTEFLARHRDLGGKGLLGLLQAAHGITSGIEKNVPRKASEYLQQDATHLWLSSAFGHPVRNLLADPPETLSGRGWQEILAAIRKILDELKQLGEGNAQDVSAWRDWRDRAIGSGSFLRQAFSSTLAETRLPNNDVTLWDQSYVAAALFKSAVAGAVLEGKGFPWTSNNIRQTTRWRLLTVGIGTDHYEARAVRIGDWLGARADIETFFARVRNLVEVDLAAGSLLYRDSTICVFSFPGERDGAAVKTSPLGPREWGEWLRGEIDALAHEFALETPAHWRLSAPTRSLVPLVQESRDARRTLAVPLHRGWKVRSQHHTGHVCPVCLVRHSGNSKDKQVPCGVCKRRRSGRLDAWLSGKLGSDTIWIDEVADANDRLALLTLSLDLDPWLDGTCLDSLRAQAAAEWRRHNVTLGTMANRVDPDEPFRTLVAHVGGKVAAYDKQDAVLGSLQEGYRHENDWPTFFAKIVEDRSGAPAWTELGDDQRARWIVHQLFRKLPSPGRLHRFWRQAEVFFDELLDVFRGFAARDPNRWRVRRLVLRPDTASANAGWLDRETYNGRWRAAPLELLYRSETRDFVTIGNLARCLEAEAPASRLKAESFELIGDDGSPRPLTAENIDTPATLGTYAPVILVDRSPECFRVLVPLSAVNACVDAAVAKWEVEFGRVWDRMPLRAGVIAFSRTTPFQAVNEAARNLEAAPVAQATETWRVCARDARAGLVALSLARDDGGTELRTIPAALPDGRTDVFYPYVAVEDRTVRNPLDFEHPGDQVYRHVLDLRPGDGIRVRPARVATLFLDTTGRRFEKLDVHPLAAWRRMRESWGLVQRVAPSLSALRGAWSELVERKASWCGADGDWLPGARVVWTDLVRAALADRLSVSGAALDALVDAAVDGTLGWAIEWHLSVLKEGLED